MRRRAFQGLRTAREETPQGVKGCDGFGELTGQLAAEEGWRQVERWLGPPLAGSG